MSVFSEAEELSACHSEIPVHAEGTPAPPDCCAHAEHFFSAFLGLPTAPSLPTSGTSVWVTGVFRELRTGALSSVCVVNVSPHNCMSDEFLGRKSVHIYVFERWIHFPQIYNRTSPKGPRTVPSPPETVLGPLPVFAKGVAPEDGNWCPIPVRVPSRWCELPPRRRPVHAHAPRRAVPASRFRLSLLDVAVPVQTMPSFGFGVSHCPGSLLRSSC